MKATPDGRGQAGFTLLELLVSMVIVLVVTGGALTAFTEAMKANETISQKLQMNDQLRIALDLMVRDLIQTGQGLPTTKVIASPSGGGASAVLRPSPPTKSYTFPVGTTEFPAVVTGDALGMTLNSLITDTITVFYADTLPCQAPCSDPFAAVNVNVAGDGSSVTVNTVTSPGRPVSGITDGVKEGDLLLFAGVDINGYAMQLATADATGSTIVFDLADPMNINQRGTATAGTIRQLDPTPGSLADSYPASMTRIRMVTYYIDSTTDTTLPRLIRRVNMNEGRIVAFGVDAVQFTYDIADGATNPTDIASPATPNQIRKVNIGLSVRSTDRNERTGDFARESIATQVSFRSLALRDRYQ